MINVRLTRQFGEKTGLVHVNAIAPGGHAMHRTNADTLVVSSYLFIDMGNQLVSYGRRLASDGKVINLSAH